MKTEFELGHITRHCESVRTWQSDEIASHSFAMARERGRTLVETLSTLAIMGILTVAGVVAYNSAMNRYRANTLINEAQKRAVVVAGQIGFNGREPSLTEFEPYNKTSAGEFKGVTTRGLYKQFGIEVSGVTKPVCQNILNTIGESTPIRRLSLEATPTTPLTTCNDTNDFLFIYNDDMQGEGSDTEYAIDDSSCKSVCGVFNPETHLCDESDCEIPTNSCTNNNQCNSQNECMVCDTESNMCKNGCERVQYLESSGTQWIDTGINPDNANTKQVDIETNFAVLTPSSDQYIGIFGAAVPRFGFYTRYNNMCFGYYAAFDNLYEIEYGKKYNLKYNVTKSNQSATLDGVTVWSATRSESLQNTYTIGLFCRNYSPPQWRNNARIYNLSIAIDGTLVRNFIPVIVPDGKACMLNRVPEYGKLKLYCDANGDTFKTNLDD